MVFFNKNAVFEYNIHDNKFSFVTEYTGGIIVPTTDEELSTESDLLNSFNDTIKEMQSLDK